MTIYQENGYTGRADYLQYLSDYYGMDIEQVYCVADLLGKTEDFDGLVSMLEDEEELL